MLYYMDHGIHALSKEAQQNKGGRGTALHASMLGTQHGPPCTTCNPESKTRKDHFQHGSKHVVISMGHHRRIWQNNIFHERVAENYRGAKHFFLRVFSGLDSRSPVCPPIRPSAHFSAHGIEDKTNMKFCQTHNTLSQLLNFDKITQHCQSY